MKYKSIYFVTTESIKNLGNFRNYLIENTKYLVTFHFPHGYLLKPSYIEIFEKGKMVYRKEFYRFKWNVNIIKLLLYYIYFNYTLFRFVKRGSFVIVENPIFCILNVIPSLVKKTKFVFWVGDYFPSHTRLMWFYNKIADFYNRTLKYVIYISPPIEKIYGSKFGERDLGNKFRKQISLGIIKRFKEINKTIGYNKVITLGFIGVIREQQGLDLVFKYLSKSQSNCRLEVVGDGYKLQFYKDMANKLGILNKVTFYGFVPNADSIIRKWDIGLALYENRKDNVSWYCEPTKIKEYLSYSLPVIATKTTYFYKELAKYSAGCVVGENTESLGKAILKIKENYNTYLRGAIKTVNKYNYEAWYNKRFSFLQT